MAQIYSIRRMSTISSSDAAASPGAAAAPATLQSPSSIGGGAVSPRPLSSHLAAPQLLALSPSPGATLPKHNLVLNLIVVRHAETEMNVQKPRLVQGQSDTPLNANGIKQALLLAHRLRRDKIDYIYSSDLLRARQTAAEIAKVHSKPVLVDQRLREQNLGDLTGLSWSAAKARLKEAGGMTLDEYLAGPRTGSVARDPSAHAGLDATPGPARAGPSLAGGGTAAATPTPTRPIGMLARTGSGLGGGEARAAVKERVVAFYIDLVERHLLDPNRIVAPGRGDGSGTTNALVEQFGPVSAPPVTPPAPTPDSTTGAGRNPLKSGEAAQGTPAATEAAGKKPEDAAAKDSSKSASQPAPARRRPRTRTCTVLVVTHGGPIKLLIEHLIEDLGFMLPGERELDAGAMAAAGGDADQQPQWGWPEDERAQARLLDTQHRLTQFPRNAGVTRLKLTRRYAPTTDEYDWRGRVAVWNCGSHLANASRFALVPEQPVGEQAAGTAANVVGGGGPGLAIHDLPTQPATMPRAAVSPGGGGSGTTSGTGSRRDLTNAGASPQTSPTKGSAAGQQGQVGGASPGSSHKFSFSSLLRSRSSAGMPTTAGAAAAVSMQSQEQGTSTPTGDNSSIGNQSASQQALAAQAATAANQAPYTQSLPRLSGTSGSTQALAPIITTAGVPQASRLMLVKIKSPVGKGNSSDGGSSVSLRGKGGRPKGGKFASKKQAVVRALGKMFQGGPSGGGGGGGGQQQQQGSGQQPAYHAQAPPPGQHPPQHAQQAQHQMQQQVQMIQQMQHMQVGQQQPPIKPAPQLQGSEPPKPQKTLGW